MTSCIKFSIFCVTLTLPEDSLRPRQQETFRGPDRRANAKATPAWRKYVTFGDENTSTRTTESGSVILAVSGQRHKLRNDRHISSARDAVVERVT